MNNYKAVSTPLVHNEKLQKEDGFGEADALQYKSLIRSLLYLTTTRLDIMYSTSLLSRFKQKPSQKNYGTARRILRYLQDIKDYGIHHKSTEDPKLLGYTDSDEARSTDDMKSNYGYAITLRSGVFSWASKEQKTMAQSSAKAKYVATANATSQAIWLWKIFEDIEEQQEEPITMLCDNK
ncbi:secreted RxLR effector protein 161-like [Arachis duranensis]|uniref:Secreted RxLR effector protein 161-like n=1 Tax=Arachis duranensis TaxID=130453 RepID=A0A9C6T5R0_ARADU|nr:secreted RxLR effector protein 161-like [Arachis duranensis]